MLADKSAGASGIPEDNGLFCLETQDASATDLLHPRNAPTIVSEKSMLPDAQENLHPFVKPSILKLCEILKLSVCNSYPLYDILFVVPIL